MTAIMTTRRALATASAYLRINHLTKHAEVVHGAQVDFVLTECHTDQQVKQQPGGGFIVTTDDWTPIQYVPLADTQDMRQLADAYKHWTAPGDGKQFHQEKDMDGKALSVLVRRAPGAFYVTRLGEIARVHGGRIRDQFKPLTADDMAKAA
jgi:hypothetical protein